MRAIIFFGAVLFLLSSCSKKTEEGGFNIPTILDSMASDYKINVNDFQLRSRLTEDNLTLVVGTQDDKLCVYLLNTDQKKVVLNYKSDYNVSDTFFFDAPYGEKRWSITTDYIAKALKCYGEYSYLLVTSEYTPTIIRSDIFVAKDKLIKHRSIIHSFSSLYPYPDKAFISKFTNNTVGVFFRGYSNLSGLIFDERGDSLFVLKNWDTTYKKPIDLYNYIEIPKNQSGTLIIPQLLISYKNVMLDSPNWSMGLTYEQLSLQDNTRYDYFTIEKIQGNIVDVNLFFTTYSGQKIEKLISINLQTKEIDLKK